MQLTICFDDISPVNAIPITANVNNAEDSVINWQALLRDYAFAKAQATMIEAPINTNLYRSGASSIADLKGLMRAEVPVCVNMLDTSANVRELLCEYSNQNEVLLDSGAFRLFQKNIRTGQSNTLDFDLVFKYYQQIICNSQNPNNITFVAPDVVGDQSASISLLQQYIEPIANLLKNGANLMLPLQKGHMSLSSCYQVEIAIIPTQYHHQIVVGLPSNAEAINTTDIIDFVKTVTPTRIHFLGASETELVHRTINASPSTSISNDATRLRKWIGEGRLLTEMHQSILDESKEVIFDGSAIPHLKEARFEYDFTEFLGNLTDFVEHSTESELKRFANKLCTTPGKLLQACEDDELTPFLDSLNHGYSDDLIYQFYQEESLRKISPKIRQYCVYRLANLGLV